mgnify:CR=1 FL=1
MASELKVDKFTGVTTAGSIDVTGEGNSTTTNLQQGLAKVWSCVEQGTTAFDDSFNCSGITDVATGRFTPAFSNNMNNALYSLTGCCDANGAVALYGGANKATSSVQLQTGDALGSSGLADYDDAMSTIHGDLA